MKHEKTLGYLSMSLIAIAFIASFAGLLFISNSEKVLTDRIRLSEEEARPANLEIIKLVSSECKDCFDIELFVTGLKDLNVKITNEKIVYINSLESLALINKYNIDKAPALIISGETSKSNIKNELESAGTRVSDVILITAPVPVYINLADKEIVGRVAMINIFDRTCTECYNISISRQILQNGFGIVLVNETTYDINSVEGRMILDKYNVTAVPTFLISPQADAYENLNQVWGQVGTIEKDGWYVFRNIGILNVPYKNITTTTI